MRINLRVCLFVFLSFLLTLYISFYVLRFFKFSGDEFSYYFQSQILSRGMLYAPSPPIPSFFQLDHVVINGGKWYSKYGFGWPAILAIGQLVKLPWLVNPLIGLISLFVLFYFVNFMYGKKLAIFSVLLLGSSPFFLFNSASFNSHPLSLLLTLASIFLFFIGLKKMENKYFAFSGFLLGFNFVVRPMSFLKEALLLGIYSLILLFREKKLFSKLLVFGFYALPMIVLALGLNLILNGNPLLFSYSVYDPSDTLIRFTNLSTIASYTFFHFKLLFFWLPVILFFVPFAKYDKTKLLLLSFFIVNVLIYLFYGTGGDQFGPRYYYSSSAFLVILAASGISRLKFANLVIAGIILVNLFMVFYFAQSISEEVSFRHQLYDAVKAKGISNSVIFIGDSSGTCLSYYNRNSPFLDSDNIYVCDEGGNDVQLKSYFPTRKSYLFNMDSLQPDKSNYHNIIIYDSK